MYMVFFTKFNFSKVKSGIYEYSNFTSISEIGFLINPDSALLI